MQTLSSLILSLSGFTVLVWACVQVWTSPAWIASIESALRQARS